MQPTRLLTAVLTILAMAGAPASTGRAEPGAAALTQIAIGTHNTLHGAASFEPFAGVIGWQEVPDPEDPTGVPLDHMYAPSNISHSLTQRLPTWGSDHPAYKLYATCT